MATLNGGEGNDTITGTNSADTINGRGGNDVIYGRGGDDIIYSGLGNDYIFSESGNDYVFLKEKDGNSLSNGIFEVDLGSDNDWLYAVIGLSPGSKIYGGQGFDTIAFGAMSGFDNNQQYFRTTHDLSSVKGFERWIFNGANSGVSGSGDFGALQYFGGLEKTIQFNNDNFNENVNNVEVHFGNYNSLDFLDASAVDLVGINFYLENGDGWTTTSGTQKADMYLGSGSADKFSGNGGDDYFDGGDGIDVSIYSGVYTNYSITEITYNTFSVKDNVGTDGTDTIIDVNKLQFSDQTVDVVIRGMQIIGDDSAEEISGGDESDHIDGAGGDDVLDGGLGNDLVEGGTGNDELIGGQGNDFLDGGADADELIGGARNDELDGGADDDLANYSDADSNLTINLTTGVATGQGTDTLISIEDVIGGSKNDTITGNNDSNEITAGSGDDYVDAGDGDDLIVGGDGAGNDIYIGGSGIDTIKYTSALAGITVNLSASSNQAKSTLSGDRAGIGIDQLSDIENIIAGNYDDVLTGNGSNNQIEAGSGNDTLSGGTGTDTLIGGLGNDILIGGGGADVMWGGEGDDVYHADNLNDRTLEAVSDTDVPLDIQRYFEVWLQSNPTWLEENGFGGIQLQVITSSEIFTGLQFSNPGKASGFDYWYKNISESIDDGGEDLVYSSVTWSLGKNVENLSLTGSAAINGTGNSLNNVITGNSGNNSLNGGVGNDRMLGGAGNDTYYVDSTSDRVYETTSTSSTNTTDAGGTDLIFSTVSLNLDANNGVRFVENLTLTGSAAINGTGNTLNNVITGNSGNNSLTGGSGNDTLNGGTGNDTLNGGTGADSLIGGTGNDTYVVDNVSDKITEALNAGTDAVQSSVTYTLAAHVENLTLTGSGAINGTGNSLNNVITGNSGSNTLNGGTGADTLIGGTGSDLLYGGADSVRDVFVFNRFAESKTGSTRDKVYDFRTTVDDLDLQGIDANTNLTGDQKFGFSTTTAKANSVWYKAADLDGNATTKEIIVYGDVNGDAKADFEIGLMGVSSITASDFIL